MEQSLLKVISKDSSVVAYQPDDTWQSSVDKGRWFVYVVCGYSKVGIS